MFAEVVNSARAVISRFFVSLLSTSDPWFVQIQGSNCSFS